jgi:hypothetical protein
MTKQVKQPRTQERGVKRAREQSRWRRNIGGNDEEFGYILMFRPYIGFRGRDRVVVMTKTNIFVRKDATKSFFSLAQCYVIYTI